MTSIPFSFASTTSLNFKHIRFFSFFTYNEFIIKLTLVTLSLIKSTIPSSYSVFSSLKVFPPPVRIQYVLQNIKLNISLSTVHNFWKCLLWVKLLRTQQVTYILPMKMACANFTASLALSCS